MKKVQQNSYNLTSDNSDKAALEVNSPQNRNFVFTRKIFINETGNITDC